MDQELSVLNRLKSFVELLEGPAAVLDSDGNVRLANAGWSPWVSLLRDHYKERRPGAPAPMSFFLFLHEVLGEIESEKAGLSAALQSLISGKAVEVVKELPLCQAGRRRWFRLRARGIEAGFLLLSIREVTTRYRAQQDLRESHSLFRHIVENTHEGVCLYNRDGCFVFANSVYAEALGFTAGQIAGRSLFEIFKPDLAQMVQEQNVLVLSTGLTLHFEMVVDTPSGPRRVFVTKDAYRNHRNEIVGVFSIVRDISDHRQVEAGLARSERHFRALIENSADRVCLLAQDGTVRYASPSTKRILGYDIEELIGTDIFLWIFPEDIAGITEKYHDLLRKPGGSISGEYRVLCKDGRWQWMEGTATNLLDDPNVGAIVLNERDISERKKAEADLLRYAKIVVSSHDAIIGADSEGIITSWNPAAERIFGYSMEEALGREVHIIVPPEQRAEEMVRRIAALKGKGADGVETLYQTKDGRQFEVSLTLSPIRDRDRRIVGFSEIIRDITDRRQLEKEILEISDREKQRLGQDLHDDLCQHLVGISLLGGILHQELSTLGLKQANDAKAITDLISGAVDHARNLARGLCPLNLVDSGFVGSLQSLASTTEQLFRIPCLFDCKMIVAIQSHSVATHIYRIVQEALHNAVKHSQATQIVLALEEADDCVVLTVRDNGIGMPETRDVVQESVTQGSLGMHTMHYRSRIIGASLEFRNNSDGGTSVICRVPRSRCSERSYNS